MIKKTENEIIEEISKEFKLKFNSKGRVFFAPSRINIIGEHIDYNGGKVLPCAISIGTYAMAQKNNLNRLRLFSMNTNSGGEISLSNLDYNKSFTWMNYVTGIVKEIQKLGKEIGGIDVVVYGNIPTESGLSSSASLEILFGEIFNLLYDLKISKVQMSIIGMNTENEQLGLNTGIMDQFAVSLGKENAAIYLDTSTLDFEYINVDLGENILAILNTNKPRSLVESKYNERRAETRKALFILKDFVDIDNLCQLEKFDNWENLLLRIEDRTIFRRALHVIKENIRVREMIIAMENKDFIKMGQLLNESHESLKNLYEVTGKELNAIVDGAIQIKGCLGARMTGGGFSGCAIALVNKNNLLDFEEKLKLYYKKETGLEADVILSEIVGGFIEIV